MTDGNISNSGKEDHRSKAFFDTLFASQPGMFDNAIANKEKWNIQIIYTQINRNGSNKPKLIRHTYNLNDNYFYPASTIKLPIALLALQKINSLKSTGADRNSTMITEAGFDGQVPVYNDPTSPDGRPSISHYIKKIFLVSDNDASNRLYEFLGQEYVNAELHKKGYDEAQILHRLAIFLSEEQNKTTNPVNFYDTTGKLLHAQQLLTNKLIYTKRGDSLGTGYYSRQQLINTPMDFSKKNRISLSSLHHILTSVVFPGEVKASQRFRITEDDRKFVLKHMSQFPHESVFPTYDSTYHDAYAKFILYGSEKGSLPKDVRIFNKVGNAYGQLVDVSYVVDFKNNIEFMVSAAITCNTDGILNDDKYDYNTIGFPFLKNLGEALYKYELQRSRKIKPDLSAFIFDYDK